MPQFPLKTPIFKQHPEINRLSELSLHHTFNQIAKKAEAANFKPSTADSRHMLDVYNKVVKDGRYVKEFSTDPEGAASKLGLKLTAPQVSEIQEAQRLSPGSKVSDDVELVCVAIIVLVVAKNPENQVIVDSSGMIKA